MYHTKIINSNNDKWKIIKKKRQTDVRQTLNLEFLKSKNHRCL